MSYEGKSHTSLPRLVGKTTQVRSEPHFPKVNVIDETDMMSSWHGSIRSSNCGTCEASVIGLVHVQWTRTNPVVAEDDGKCIKRILNSIRTDRDGPSGMTGVSVLVEANEPYSHEFNVFTWLSNAKREQ